MDHSRQKNLEYLFRPRSIAILGASSDLNKVSGRPLAYMLRFGYQGKIYPINPKYPEIAGVKCYPDIKEVPGEVDVLMVIIPAPEIRSQLEASLAKKVKAAIIISGGFAETGEEGRKLQQEITEFAHQTGMLVYGPNTTGFVSLVHRSIATFSQSLEVIEDIVPGKTGLITQSGAFGAAIFVRAMRVGLGLSHWAATGNEADLEFCDFLEYMVEDPHTRVIAGFLAGVEDGQKLIRGLDQAARKGKPVVLLKVGNTEASERAAYSHTGAMVGSTRAYEAVFKQKGVTLAQDIQELIDHSLAFASSPLPRGKRVGIMTESGGGGVLLTERCSQMGLTVAEIQGSTREKLQTVVPSLGSVRNPVDLTGQSLSNPALVKSAIEVMLEADDFDIVVPLLLMSKATAERKIRDLVQLHERHGKDKLLQVCWPEGPKEWIQHLIKQGIYVSVTPSRCAQTLGALAEYGAFQKRLGEAIEATEKIIELPADRKARSREVIEKALRTGGKSLNEFESKKILKAYGIPTTQEALANSAEEAVGIARRLGYPVAAKLVSPDILHKTEAGVVALNLESDQKLIQAYGEVRGKGKAYRPQARIEGVLIQQMIMKPGVEVIAGVADEPPFGPALLFGLGGIFVEVLQDVAVRVLPASPEDVRGMISEIGGYRILQGVRGRKAADLKVLQEILLRLACLAQELKDVIAEIDINPLIVQEEGGGAQAVDALILLK